MQLPTCSSRVPVPGQKQPYIPVINWLSKYPFILRTQGRLASVPVYLSCLYLVICYLISRLAEATANRENIPVNKDIGSSRQRPQFVFFFMLALLVFFAAPRKYVISLILLLFCTSDTKNDRQISTTPQCIIITNLCLTN